MSFFQSYIDKNVKNLADNNIISSPAGLFVIIPSYNEPDIRGCLSSLSQCNPPQSRVSVIIVVNSSEDSPREVLQQNLKTIDEIEIWKRTFPDSFLDIHSIHVPDLPRKYAGVGWARKIGMDEAVKQLMYHKREDGILVSFDADSTVMPNYLHSVEQAFAENPNYNFFTIDFAHPLDEKLTPETKEGIIRYEIHMRYYKNAMLWCGYPHAIHTVGSSFAVRASAYVRQGGMNRRKAGEDFYFLHKIVLLGKYGNMINTTVFPSSRESDRVPFGTGAAMKKWAQGGSELYYTYSLDAFIALKNFFENPVRFLHTDEGAIFEIVEQYPEFLKDFIKKTGTIREIMELQLNCAGAETFTKRFFHRINAFWILKYLNYAHEKFLERGDLFEESEKLLQFLGINVPENVSPEQLLDFYRKLDRKEFEITLNNRRNGIN